MSNTAEITRATASASESPRRHVRIGQTWRRNDPSGSFEEFEVTCFCARKGIPNALVRGRTRRGKPVVAALGFMQTSDQYELLRDTPTPEGT